MQLQLQHDQEQLSLRAKISEVEAEERVYQKFEENDGCSDRTSVVRSSVKKSSLNPNATEWPACTSGDVKEEIPVAQDQGAKVEVKGQDAPVQGIVPHVRPNSSLCDEPRLLQMINMIQLPKAEFMTFNGDPLECSRCSG